MFRKKIKCRFLFLFGLLILNVFTKSLPIEKSLSALLVSDTSLPKLEMPKFDGTEVISESETTTFKTVLVENARQNNETILTEDHVATDASKVSTNRTRSLTSNISSGQIVNNYSVKISFDGGMFNGLVVINVEPANSDDPIIFHLEALDVHEVRTGLHSVDGVEPAEFEIGDGIIEIFQINSISTSYVVIEYSGEISNFGKGIFQGGFND